MKKSILKSALPLQSGFILLMLITFCWGCKKDTNKGCTDPAAKNFELTAEENDGSCIYPVAIMQAKVDGILVVCDSMIQVDWDFTTIYGVYGGESNGYFFKMQFPADLGIGNYPFLTFNTQSSFMNDAFLYSPVTSYHCYDGSATITDYSEHNIKGTFSYNLIGVTNDTIHVTDGVFDIDYNY